MIKMIHQTLFFFLFFFSILTGSGFGLQVRSSFVPYLQASSLQLPSGFVPNLHSEGFYLQLPSALAPNWQFFSSLF
jgi:hypothetical protein